MRLFQLMLVISVSCGLLCCKKEKKTPVVAGPDYKSRFFSKDSVPCPSSSLGGTIVWDSVAYSAPSFNPDDPSELLYLRYTPSRQEYRIDKVNLKTGATAIVYRTQQDVISTCAWGRNNQVFFCEASAFTAVWHYDVYRIEADGTGKTRLTQSAEAAQVRLNYNQTQYMYGSGNTGESYIANISNNQVTDTVTRLISAFDSWVHPYFLAYPDTLGLRYYDVIHNMPINITEVTWPATQTKGACTWLNDAQTIVFAEPDGIYSFNIESKKKQLLASSCIQREYTGTVAYAPLSRKLVWQRVEYTQGSNGNTRARSQLIMMNTNGEDRQVMVLP